MSLTMRTRVALSILLILVASGVVISLSQRVLAQSSVGMPYQVSTITSTVTSASATSSTSNQTTGWFGTGFIVEDVKVALKPYRQIPQSTIFVIGLAMLLGLTSSTAAKLLVDYDMIRKTAKQLQAWRKQVDAAKKA